MLSTPLPTNWDLQEPVPNRISPRALESAIEEHRRALNPSTVQEFGAVVGKAMEWAAAFGITVAEPRQVTAQYREALADLPIDLLVTAFRRTQADWQWRNMPLPGQIREHVEELYTQRVRELARLEYAQRKQREGFPRPVESPAADESRAALVAANERWLFHKASPEDIRLLNALRAKHGKSPLPTDAERGGGIQAMPGTHWRKA